MDNAIIEITPDQVPGRFAVNLIRPKRAQEVYTSGRIDLDLQYELIDHHGDLTPHQVVGAINSFHCEYDITETHRSPVAKALPWPVS